MEALEEYRRRGAGLESMLESFGHPRRLHEAELLCCGQSVGRKATTSAATGVCCIKKRTRQSGA
jgi:hypothetical protein